MNPIGFINSEKTMARIIADRDDMIIALSRDMVALAQENAVLKQQQPQEAPPCQATAT